LAALPPGDEPTVESERLLINAELLVMPQPLQCADAGGWGSVGASDRLACPILTQDQPHFALETHAGEIAAKIRDFPGA
jgi:hypothetical protein